MSVFLSAPATPVLWLDPSQSASLVLVSSAVSEWRDIRAPIAAAQQGTSANRPTLVTNVQNGLPVVRFDGTNDYLDLVGGQALSDFTIAMVTKLSGDVTKPQFGIATANAFSPTWSFDPDAARFRNNDASNTIYSVSYGATLTGQTSVAVLRRGGSQLMASIDGTAYAAITCATTAQSLRRIGARGIGPYANYYNGDIGEVLIWDRALTDAQRQEVEGYLAYKWGLNTRLPSGHPYYDPNIAGNCIVSGNGGAQQVVIRNATTRVVVGVVTPNATTGAWSATVPVGDYDISYFAPDCQPVCHGPYTVTA